MKNGFFNPLPCFIEIALMSIALFTGVWSWVVAALVFNVIATLFTMWGP